MLLNPFWKESKNANGYYKKKFIFILVKKGMSKLWENT